MAPGQIRHRDVCIHLLMCPVYTFHAAPVVHIAFCSKSPHGVGDDCPFVFFVCIFLFGVRKVNVGALLIHRLTFVKVIYR